MSFPPGSETPQKQAAGPKIPMPAEEELEERFNVVLVSRCRPHTDTHGPVYGACEGTHSLLHSPIQKLQTTQHKETKNAEHFENVHIPRTGLSASRVHKVTVER